MRWSVGNSLTPIHLWNNLNQNEILKSELRWNGEWLMFRLPASLKLLHIETLIFNFLKIYFYGFSSQQCRVNIHFLISCVCSHHHSYFIRLPILLPFRLQMLTFILKFGAERKITNIFQFGVIKALLVIFDFIFLQDAFVMPHEEPVAWCFGFFWCFTFWDGIKFFFDKVSFMYLIT